MTFLKTVRWPTARLKCSGAVNALKLVVQWLERVSSYLMSTYKTLCPHLLLVRTLIHSHTHTSVHGYLFVHMWISWVQCVHMTASVKCGFGWQRKESLYLWNSTRLHATALRGENAKLACHSLVEMSFPYVCRTGSIFSYKKKISSFAISMAPAILSLSFFFFQQHISAVEFPLLFGMREFGGGGGAVSFSRVYQAPESGCISDFTRGKSKPSAAVDSGEVESAH